MLYGFLAKIFCHGGQAAQLRFYPMSTNVSFGFTTIVLLATFLVYGSIVHRVVALPFYLAISMVLEFG